MSERQVGVCLMTTLFHKAGREVSSRIKCLPRFCPARGCCPAGIGEAPAGAASTFGEQLSVELLRFAKRGLVPSTFDQARSHFSQTSPVGPSSHAHKSSPEVKSRSYACRRYSRDLQ